MYVPHDVTDGHVTTSDNKGGNCARECDGDARNSPVPKEGDDVLARGGDDRVSRRLAFWKEVLSDERELRGWTGFGPHAFAIIWASFADVWERMERAEIDRRREYAEGRRGMRGPRPRADAEADRKNNVPLIRDDPARGSSPGNRCRLDPVYILLLALVRKYHGEGEWRLGSLFGVDQATASRYIRLADRVLAGILPTPERLLGAVREVDSPEAFAALFPEGTGDTTVVIDGTHVRFVRPLRREERDPMYSGKKKYPSGNTVVMTSGDGLILGISKTHAGRAHDITITREFLKTLGRFGEMLLGLLPAEEAAAEAGGEEAGGEEAGGEEAGGEGAVAEIIEKMRESPKDRMQVLGDSGFQGIQDDLQGADAFTPIKRPRNGKLTAKQKKYNRELSRRRVIVENAIGAAKQFRRISATYEGDFERFNEELQIAAGLANLRHMLRNDTYGHWSQRLGLRAPDKDR